MPFEYPKPSTFQQTRLQIAKPVQATTGVQSVQPQASYSPPGSRVGVGIDVSGFTTNLPESTTPQQPPEAPPMPFQATATFRERQFVDNAPDYVKADALMDWNRNYSMSRTAKQGFKDLAEYDQWFNARFAETKNADAIGGTIMENYYKKHMPQNVRNEYAAEQQMAQRMAQFQAAQKELEAKGMAGRYEVGPTGEIREKRSAADARAVESGLVEGPRPSAAPVVQSSPQGRGSITINGKEVVNLDEVRKPAAAQPAPESAAMPAGGEPRPYALIDGQRVPNPKYEEWKQFEGYGNQQFAALPYARKSAIIRQYESLVKESRLAMMTDDELKELKANGIDPRDMEFDKEWRQAKIAKIALDKLNRLYGFDTGTTESPVAGQPKPARATVPDLPADAVDAIRKPTPVKGETPGQKAVREARERAREQMKPVSWEELKRRERDKYSRK